MDAIAGAKQLKSGKHKGLWPLPGGTTSYIKTLYRIINKIKVSDPTFEELLSWFKREYNLTGEKTPRSMFQYLIRFGFFTELDNKIILSKDSEEFLRTKENSIVYNMLNNSVLGIEDSLILLYKYKELYLTKINKWFVEKYNVNWTTNAQVSFRINWLRSLGYVERKGKVYSVTEKGKKIVQNLEYDDDYYLLEVSKDQIPQIIVQKPKIEQQIEEPMFFPDNFSNQLLSAQKDTANPEKYELLITSLFEQLGFVSKHIGGSGEPDVVFNAPQGFKSYKGIIDCKTGSSPIGEYRIDWLTLEEHKKKYDADYIVVVGPDFAGGRLLKRALEKGITLVKTEFLLKLLKLHNETPVSLTDLQPLFEKKGLLGNDELQFVDIIINNYNHYSQIISSIFTSLEEMTPKKERLDVSGLRIYLNYTKNVKCSMKDVEKCLMILENKPICAIKREDDYIIPIVTLNTLKKKFKYLIDYFEK